MNEDFSSRLKTARGDMSQAELCKLIDVKQGTYSTWELGKYEPPFDKLSSIARITGRSTDWLLGIETNGNRLRKARQAVGWTVQRLAAKLEVPEEYVTEWENGTRELGDGFMTMCANALDVSVEHLTGDKMMPVTHEKISEVNVPCKNCERLQKQIDLLMEEGIAKTRIIENLSKNIKK